ncbi:MAG: hypothetical protein CMF23_07915 [Ignavibacteriae bacterium]|nr:hypothetical protein [Ignavibacteriota bacterium]|tara:strand:+ start:82 stop:390 length:309 start_codon:yes stop_codon:yes gene_type:complete
MESKDELRLYSLSEAAKFLGISRMTLSNLIDCGKIDFINSPTGKRKQFTEKILRNYLENQKNRLPELTRRMEDVKVSNSGISEFDLNKIFDKIRYEVLDAKK